MRIPNILLIGKKKRTTDLAASQPREKELKSLDLRWHTFTGHHPLIKNTAGGPTGMHHQNLKGGLSSLMRCFRGAMAWLDSSDAAEDGGFSIL